MSVVKVLRRSILAISVALAACSTSGQPLDHWTLDVDGGPHGVAVTLPGNFKDAMPLAEADYTLTTEVALPPALRGTSIAVVFDCFHAPLHLMVNGQPIEDRGDGANGGWRFRLDPPTTNADSLTLQLAVHRDPISMIGFGTVPRLVADPRGDARWRGVLLFNRYSAIVALCFALLMSVIYTALCVLERRPEYAAILVNSIAVVGVPLLQLGVITDLGPTVGPRIFYLTSLGQFVSLIYFIHAAFELGRVHRGWWLACALGWIADVGSSTSFVAAVVLGLAKQLLTISVNTYVVTMLIRLTRRGPRRLDAGLMLAGWGTNVVWIAFLLVWISTGREHLGGVHPLCAGIALTSALQALIIARHHVARQRAVEAASVELKHQVAERSRELGDALAKLASEPPRSVDSGSVIDGRYRVLRRLGAGGMGEVHEVERITDHQHFALKTLRGRGNAATLARFAREAQIAADFDHPNLVPVVDVGIAHGALFLVMPLIEGGSLERHRDRFGDHAWARPVLAQVAAGLASLHARQIVHRDLKPSNVLLAGAVARIADFGLASLREARHPEGAAGADAHTPASASIPALADTMTGQLGRDPASPPLTRAGDVFGTPAYMAPELADGVHAVQSSSDVFAFGLLAHEVATGRHAFATPPLVARLAGQPAATRAPHDVPAPLGPLIDRCLAMAPEERPSMADVAAALGERAGG